MSEHIQIDDQEPHGRSDAPSSAAAPASTTGWPAPATKQRSRLGDIVVRACSGAIYVAATAACAFLGGIPFLLYLMALAAICAKEFFTITQPHGSDDTNTIIGVVGAVSYLPLVLLFGIVGALGFAVAYLAALFAFYAVSKKTTLQDMVLLYAGSAYTGLIPCGLLLISQSVYGLWGSVLLLGVFASVWLSDALAYLVGCKIGRHKIAPRISPKKSWEGFIAGLAASVCVWVVMSFIPGITVPWLLFAVFGVLVALAAFAGDLVESKIKRMVGAKDAGAIMPGHGGLLDRCDSILFASPVAYALLVASGAIYNVLI